MPSENRAKVDGVVLKGSPTYPDRLIERLGAHAPQSFYIIGSNAPLVGSLTAFMCSKDTPGTTILKAFDQAAAWRDAGCCVISGFHSPLEKECLSVLLRGKQPVVLGVARGLGALRLPPDQRRALDDGRLTIISPFGPHERRTTIDLASRRNRFIAALADKVVFGFITAGGSLAALREEVISWRIIVEELCTEITPPKKVGI
jgi:predicted Rossmann fold nucleotide-binding protein DprA/Smf involved in DNA uptake